LSGDELPPRSLPKKPEPKHQRSGPSLTKRQLKIQQQDRDGRQEEERKRRQPPQPKQRRKKKATTSTTLSVQTDATLAVHTGLCLFHWFSRICGLLEFVVYSLLANI
jgi:hypothetical protein